MIKLVPKFSKADIRKMLEEKKKIIFNTILENLKLIGEEFIASARSTITYTDQTGNLRSSIGYIILYNGLQYFDGGFIQIKQGSKGVKVGKELIEEIIKKFPTGLVLVGIAGMDYAAI